MGVRVSSLLFVLCACVTPRGSSAITLPASHWATDTSVHWYDISGATRSQLRSQLDRLGPEDAAGQHHDAYTEWYVTWRFPLVENELGCVTGPVTTVVRVKVTLPRWAPPREVDPALPNQWARYLESLFVHESGHRDTGLRAAGEIAETLPALPPQPSCPDAETAGNDAARRVLETYRKADTQYDDETRHGATQGAVFP